MELLNQKDILKMSPWDFDQSPEGWRGVEAKEGRIKAAELIIKYMEVNKDSIDKDSKIVGKFMNFHVGQLLASEGGENTGKSVPFFEQSFINGKDCWNAYVSGTIAFLKGDVESVKSEIKVINNSESDKVSGNLPVLNNFLKVLMNGGGDYNTAYNMPRQM